jgi:hypothetical protein
MNTAKREVDEAMNSHGFSHTTTGGGCTAYEKADPAVAGALLARLVHSGIAPAHSGFRVMIHHGTAQEEEQEIASASSILITVQDDASAPASIDDACTIGIYSAGGDQITFFTAPDVWAALSEVQGPPR